MLDFGGPAVDFGIPQLRLTPGAGYDVPAGSYVLVRPDGYVAAMTDSADMVREQLRRFDPVREPTPS
ncbi:FAD-dependent monooxygenase [Mycolicibacterium aubagnense]